MNEMDLMDPEYIKKKNFYEAIVITYSAAINFAHRYAAKAREMAASCPDPVRKAELLQIAANCDRVPERGATNFYEACQAFWFVQILLQIEANGHSISPRTHSTSICIRIWLWTNLSPKSLLRS